jgi:glucitol/sorbitol PTS system EIIA component
VQTIYLTQVTGIGPEAPDFLEEGLMILFEDGAPPELAEISILHKPTEKRESPPEPGDVLAFGKTEFRVTAVGEKAWKNVLELGHACFKFNGRDEAELPGEISCEERGGVDLRSLVEPGTRIEIKTAGARDVS